MDLHTGKHMDAEQKRIKKIAEQYRQSEDSGCGPVITKQLKRCSVCGSFFDPTHGLQKKCPTCRGALKGKATDKKG